jgi:hypothetical protein
MASVAVARYPSIVPPPADDDALHVTSMVWSPGVSETSVGYDGTVIGVASMAFDAAEVPAAFVAVTVTEYCTPLVSDEIEHEVAVAPAVHV